MLDADFRRASGADFAKEIRGSNGRQFRRLLQVGRAMTPAFRTALEISIPIFGVAAVWPRLPASAIKRSPLVVAAGATLIGRSAIRACAISVVLTPATVGKAFAAKTTLMETTMLEAPAAKTTSTEAVMGKTPATKTVMAEAMMAGSPAAETIAAKFVAIKAMAP
jgi:hypothetical protein